MKNFEYNIKRHRYFELLILKFNKIISVNPSFAERLYELKGYEIVFIYDDSDLMTTSIVVDLASVLDSDGVDVYFLNHESMLHVHNSSE